MPRSLAPGLLLATPPLNDPNFVKALTYLEEKGDLELRVAGVRQGYRMVRDVVDAEPLITSLTQRFSRRETSDIQRVAAMATQLTTPGCLVRRILEYFGETLGRDCGHCGPCRGDPPVVLERPTGAFSLSGDAEIAALRSAHPQALGSARQLARFLCGVSSPALVTAKLTRHPRFGSAGSIPFDTILRACAGPTF